MPGKIVLPLVLIIGGISWLAFTNLSKANYFYNVNELPEMGDPIYDHGLKVKGRIVVGSIDKSSKPFKFTIHEESDELRVLYTGTEPLPDMFKDRAEAVVEGTMRKDGVFEATHVQAKCASKYEAGAPDASEGYSEGYEPKEPTPPPAKGNNT